MEHGERFRAARTIHGDEVPVARAVRRRVVAGSLDEGEGRFMPGLGGQRMSAREVEDVHFVLVGPTS